MKRKVLKVSKGTIIQQKGDTNTQIYMVKKGLLRSYTIDKKGKEHIFTFAPEGWTIADACTGKEACTLFIDAVEDTECLVREKKPDVELTAHGFMALRNRMFVLQQRVLMLMSSSALERYEHFIATYPEILQRVPQKMIASYLGITPEALSKIRSERAKSK